MLDPLQAPSQAVWFTEADCDIDAFKRLVERETPKENYPLASALSGHIPVYDGDELRQQLQQESDARRVMSEWNRCLQAGPGIVVIRRGYSDTPLIDAVTDQLNAIIADEEAAGAGAGDHFAAAGANSRIWNAHEKLCMRAPELYARYNANEITRRISESWLGPGYQMTYQVNMVRPGGKAQVAHRDYHMGFQSAEVLRQYPASQHAISASLTLQGAVAHSDMPVETGPTKLLPYSQTYLAGYIAILQAEFRDYFEANFVQVPLERGDMLFFNPACFHAAGDNLTQDKLRIANLMQVGSGYGRSIEIVDRARISLGVFETLTRLQQDGELSAREIDTVIAATAEAYPFPANLDIDSPLTGMAPPSQQDVLRQAVAESWSLSALTEAINAQQARKRSH